MLGVSGLAEKLNFSSMAVLQVGTENELFKVWASGPVNTRYGLTMINAQSIAIGSIKRCNTFYSNK